MNELLSYLVRILPGMLLAGVLLFQFRGKSPIFHLMIYLMLFIFTRDAMTPERLWFFGTEGFFWLRFTPNILVLLFSGVCSLFVILVMNYLSPELKSVLVWQKGNRIHGVIAGVLTAVVVALPLLIFYTAVPIENRGGSVPVKLLPFLLFLTLTGNLYEEVLFRGYIQGWVEKKMGFSEIKAALTSGVFFGFGHLFLAFTVSDIGWPIIIFATWEGCIAGLVRSKWGIIPATLTHGLAIFILASGII